MKIYKDKPTTCQVGPARAIYPYVFKARKNELKEGQPMEYKITLLIPKTPHSHLPTPDEEIKGLRECMKQAAIETFGPNPPKGLKYPLKDGDVAPEGEEPPHPGNFYITAKTNAAWPDGEPKNLVVCDGRGVPIGAVFGGGDWCKVKITFKGYNNQANKGVAAYLGGVQWLYKDDAIGGGGADTTPEEFEAVADAHTALNGHGNGSAVEEYDPFAEG